MKSLLHRRSHKYRNPRLDEKPQFQTATFAVGSDKTPPTYQKGTIKGWDKRTDIWGFLDRNGEPIPRNKTVFELRGTDLVYLIDYCGAFQAGNSS
jgi:hypothetical protein